ncbi:MAG: ABC transporter substrate-binding protein [Pseudomonadota bacterium]|nr:ABC transporter substrate-binding protein [Pseudomonadota bacterium]
MKKNTKTISNNFFVKILFVVFLLSSQTIYFVSPVLSKNATVLRIGVPIFPPQKGNPFSSISLPLSLPNQAIYDPLFLNGSNGEVLPWLATRWQQKSPNHWIFNIRKGVKFSNGENLDSDSVVAAFRYLLTSEGQRDSISSLNMAEILKNINSLDSHTVEIITNQPNPILPLHLVFMNIPAPYHWKDLGRDRFMISPVGSGPFIVEEWKENFIRMAANPLSWRPPEIDFLEIIRIPDQTSRLQALLSGAIDIALSLAPQNTLELDSLGAQLVNRPLQSLEFIAFVTQMESPLRDKRVKKALNYAVNKEQMIDVFLNNATKPASQFSHDGAFGFSPELKPYKYDPDKARSLLSSAGYQNGFKLPVLIASSSGGDNSSWYQQIAMDLEHVGVKMVLQTTPLTRMIQFVQSGKWPVPAFGWNFSGNDSLRGYRFRSCEWTNPYHCDPFLMPLIKAAKKADSFYDRQFLTQKVLAYERDNPPGILLWRGVAFDGIGNNVKDFRTLNGFVSFHKIALKD